MDDVDKALADYEPSDTEGDVQDESVRMQSAPTFNDIPRDPVAQATDSENPDNPAIVGTSQTQAGVYRNATDAQLNDGLSYGNPSSKSSPTGADPLAAAKDALAKGNATAAAAGDVGAAQSEHAQSMAQAAEDRDVQAKLDAVDRQDQADAQAKALEATHKETEAASKKYDEFKFHDHWKEASVGNKVLAVLFSGIGGAAAARTGGQNEALRAMDDISQREYQKDVQNLNKAETFMKWKKEGETDLQARFGKEKANLQMQQAARLKQMADVAEAHYVKTHPGATVEDAKSNQIVAGLTQKAAETYSGAVQNIYKIEAAKQAALLKAKKAGAGGGVSGDTMAKLSTYAKEHPGDDAGLYRLAGELKVPSKHMIAAATAARAPEEKRIAGAEKEATAKDARTVTLGGKEYLAATSRNVMKTQERATNYDDAERSLEELLDYHKTDPIKAKLAKLTDEDRYHRAVLAVAAVTTANASDKTTAHEAGTINRFGLGDQEAVKRTIDHIKERKKAFIDNLKPRNNEPSPSKSSKSESSIPADVIQRARDRAATGDTKAVNWLKGHGL